MNFQALRQIFLRRYPALKLERFLSHSWRTILRRVFATIFIISLALFLIVRSDLLLGIWLVSLVLFFKFLIIEAFCLDSYFGSTYEIGRVLSQLSENDVTGSFCKTPIGSEIIWRSGVSSQAIGEFLKTRVGRIALAQLVVSPASEGEAITLADLTKAIYETDKEFGQCLFQQGVQAVDLAATADWIIRTGNKRKLREHWWSREALSRVPSIAKDWSYGRAYDLGKYVQPLPPVQSEQALNYNKSEVEKIEAVLARGREDNVMLVGDDNERKLEIVALLAKLIEEDRALAPLARKEVVMLDAEAFSATNDSKGSFERGFIKAMNDAVHAGNLIVVFPEFTTLARSAETLGSNLSELIAPYLTSANLQIIALCTTDEFHRVWEGKAEVMERFEKILLTEVSGAAVLPILEDEASVLESTHGVLFTRPALKAIGDDAERYLPGGILPDAAIDLAFDLASQKRDRHLPIAKSDVEELIRVKTGIPVGSIGGEERFRLANLERSLRERIIGQEEAIAGVANALRRARAGISNPNRPIGTFLFLGPTGVGKTETIKALALSYFNDEKKIHRVDMSEYSSADALNRLIGILADKMREQPYGILLLDEFEKATSEVHNLFLQILDEGFFSDLAGKRVSVRNQMIIATSNAGSDLIWETMEAGRNLEAEKSNIIDQLISRSTFKPELLNRFDGVIFFHPLSLVNLKEIAHLMLAKLAARLRTRGTMIEVSDDLVDYLVQKGSDPKFGARSMNRAIQDNVEQIIANKIVLENIKPGQTIKLTRADLEV